MTKTVAIAYTFQPIIEEKWKRLSEDEKWELARKHLKVATIEEAKREAELKSRKYGEPVEKFLRVWGKLQLEKELSQKYEETLRSIATESSWKTEERIRNVLDFLRSEKIPFFMKEFGGIADEGLAERETRSAPVFSKFKGVIGTFTWIVPDKEDSLLPEFNIEKLREHEKLKEVI